MGTHPIFESDFDCLTEKMEVDSVAEPESLLSDDDLAMEIAIREAFVEDLANLAIISPARIQDLYQKYVKRPRKYKEFELPKVAATHLAMAAKHFVAHVLQIGLQHHLTQKPGELVIEYDDMAEAIASDPRMKKLQGMLPRRITFEEAMKLRNEKFKAKEASKIKEREELLAFEQFVPKILKSKSFMEIEGLKEKMRQRAPGGSVDEPESMEVVPAGPSHEKKTYTKLEREKDGIIEISDSPEKKKNKKNLQKELSNEEQKAQEVACSDTASQGDVPARHIKRFNARPLQEFIQQLAKRQKGPEENHKFLHQKRSAQKKKERKIENLTSYSLPLSTFSLLTL